LTVTLELDRVFICVAPGAPEADALAASTRCVRSSTRTAAYPSWYAHRNGSGLMTETYVHGYHARENERLQDQAGTLVELLPLGH